MRSLVAALLVGCLSTTALAAPSLVAPLSLGAPDAFRTAKVGQWVTYLLDGGNGRASFWRMAVVGEERDKRGREAVWIELELGEHPALVAPLAQLRLLVAREEGMSPSGITRLIVGHGLDRPREAGPETLALFTAPAPVAAASHAARPPPPLRQRPPARLMTAAGTLDASATELVSHGVVVQRIWLSPQVPLLGLARLELPALGHRMEVHAFGTDARSRIAYNDAPTLPASP